MVHHLHPALRVHHQNALADILQRRRQRFLGPDDPPVLAHHRQRRQQHHQRHHRARRQGDVLMAAIRGERRRVLNPDQHQQRIILHPAKTVQPVAAVVDAHAAKLAVIDIDQQHRVRPHAAIGLAHAVLQWRHPGPHNPIRADQQHGGGLQIQRLIKSGEVFQADRCHHQPAKPTIGQPDLARHIQQPTPGAARPHWQPDAEPILGRAGLHLHNLAIGQIHLTTGLAEIAAQQHPPGVQHRQPDLRPPHHRPIPRPAVEVEMGGIGDVVGAHIQQRLVNRLQAALDILGKAMRQIAGHRINAGLGLGVFALQMQRQAARHQPDGRQCGQDIAQPNRRQRRIPRAQPAAPTGPAPHPRGQRCIARRCALLAGHPGSDRGSKADCKPSPKKLIAITLTSTSAPG